MNKGKIVQVMGPVVDVVFENGELPDIREALEVENNGKKCIMEVSQHLGNRIVRCIMLSASEGLQRDREVTRYRKRDQGSGRELYPWKTVQCAGRDGRRRRITGSGGTLGDPQRSAQL